MTEVEKEELTTLGLYLDIHPVMGLDNTIRNRYFYVLSSYVKKFAPKSSYAKALLETYREAFGIKEKTKINSKAYNFSGIFRFRFIMLIDIWYFTSFGKPDKAERELDEIIIKSGLKEHYRKKFKSLFNVIFGNDSSANFSQLTNVINRWKTNQNFLEKQTYKIGFTATTSAGKSTLINAIVGKQVNRSRNLSCTAKIHYISNKPFEDGFVSENDFLLTLNADYQTLMDDNNQNKSGRIDVTSYFRSNAINGNKIMLIDTPGVNSSLNKEHELLTRKGLQSEKMNLLVYVINSNYIGVEDDRIHLRWILDTLKRRNIIFAVNKLDSFTSEDNISDAINNVREYVKDNGYDSEPIICPVSARAGMLAKRRIYDNNLDENDLDELSDDIRRFSHEEYNLNKYYPKQIVKQCKDIIETEKNNSIYKNLELILNCGLMPLEHIILKYAII